MIIFMLSLKSEIKFTLSVSFYLDTESSLEMYDVGFSSVHFSRSVVSNSLRPPPCGFRFH